MIILCDVILIMESFLLNEILEEMWLKHKMKQVL